jgi:A/G-specific adenine glycosylase
MNPPPSRVDIEFRRRLIAWQKQHGRHDLPWQNTRDAYRIWVSEIMLQQTQVSTVIPKYAAFMRCFPTVRKLAAAPLDDVMALWAGLGYYARARNMHRAAQEVAASFNGRMPHDAQTLPGIGRSTAAAIAVFSSGERAAILDGNVKRVLSRVFMLAPGASAAATDRELWTLAERLLPSKHLEAYTQGLMDLGATLCTPRNPDCKECPVSAMCAARKADRISEFPVRAVKRLRPLKSCQLIVAHHRGSTLLERRPAKGIWGGLWSFPEAETGADAVTELQRRYGARGRLVKCGAVLRHEFTHFSLDITPVILQIDRLSDDSTSGANLKWVNRKQVAKLGVPAPVGQLIEQYLGA